MVVRLHVGAEDILTKENFSILCSKVEDAITGYIQYQQDSAIKIKRGLSFSNWCLKDLSYTRSLTRERWDNGNYTWLQTNKITQFSSKFF